MAVMRSARIHLTVPLLAALLCGCDGPRPETAVAAAPSNASAVNAPVSNPPADPVFASGPLGVEHQVDISSQRDGMVLKILAEPGKRVRSGDLLAQLDDQ